MDYFRDEQTGCSCVTDFFESTTNLAYVALQDFGYSGKQKKCYQVMAFIFNRNDDKNHFYGIEDICDQYHYYFYQDEHEFHATLSIASSCYRELRDAVKKLYFSE